MAILEIIRQIDWQDDNNKKIGLQLMADAKEYLKRVEAHIFGGNEIRADAFMDVSEKQDAIRSLDRKRTAAHNEMLESFGPFLDLLKDNTSFDANDWKLANRTQIADFVCEIAFEALGVEPASRGEGDIRDELAEKMHKQELTYEQIETSIKTAAFK